MREDEIRPEILRDRMRKAFLKDLKMLLSYRDMFVTVPCPACGKKRNKKKFTKNSLIYVECLECETLYINPRPTPMILNKFYQNSENYKFWNKYVFPPSEEARRKNIFRPRAEKIKKLCERYNIIPKTFLEIGAGFGTFCQEIRKTKIFKEILAIEPTPYLAETCRKRGFKVIENLFEDANIESNTIDVIASFEVIEHLFDPKNFLEKCNKILKGAGILILTCPNIKGFDVLVLEKQSDVIDHEHLNYFHTSSLTKLLSRCGFNLVEISTPGKLDAELVRKKALNGDYNIANPFLHRILIEEWEKVGLNFQKFLSENLLSSHLWMVGIKSPE